MSIQNIKENNKPTVPHKKGIVVDAYVIKESSLSAYLSALNTIEYFCEMLRDALDDKKKLLHFQEFINRCKECVKDHLNNYYDMLNEQAILVLYDFVMECDAFNDLLEKLDQLKPAAFQSRMATIEAKYYTFCFQANLLRKYMMSLNKKNHS